MELKFADVVISVLSADGRVEFEISPGYRPFLCQGQPDVNLQVHCGRFPLSELGDLIFDSGGSWSLYAQAGGKGVILYNGSAELLPFRGAVFTPDFLSGNIYIEREVSHLFLPYPLTNSFDMVLMANLLSRGHGVVLHACGLSDGGRGILFAGVSGSGKSTLAVLWEEQGGVTLLSDERVIVRKWKGRFWVYGTPWYGDVREASPEGVPLEQVFIIQHASGNRVVPLKSPDAASRLLVRSFPTFWDAEGMAFTLEFLEELSQAVPCYELGFVPDESAVDFVRCLK